jgi:hypothetical protein
MKGFLLVCMKSQSNLFKPIFKNALLGPRNPGMGAKTEPWHV